MRVVEYAIIGIKSELMKARKVKDSAKVELLKEHLKQVNELAKDGRRFKFEEKK